MARQDDPLTANQGDRIILLLERIAEALDQPKKDDLDLRFPSDIPRPHLGRYEQAEYPDVCFNVFFDRFSEAITNPNGNGQTLYPPNGSLKDHAPDTIFPRMKNHTFAIRAYDVKDYESASKSFDENDINIFPVDLWVDMEFGKSISSISDNAKKLIADKKLSLFLCLMGEAFGCDYRSWIAKLSQAIIGHGLAQGKIAISCADLRFAENYEEWSKNNTKITSMFKFENIFPYEYFQLLYAEQFQARTGRWLPGGKPAKFGDEGVLRPISEAEVMLSVPDGTTKTTDFLCMNARSRPHRIAIVSELHRLGLDKNFISLLFRGDDVDSIVNQDAVINFIRTQFMDTEAKRNHFNTMFVKNRSKRKIILDADEAVHADDRILNTKYFDESYFSLVTETNFGVTLTDTPAQQSYNTTMFITEKTFKPIAYFHPIIILGSPYTLAFLKDEGYDTFEEMFDESYDLMLDPQERFNAVVTQVNNWCRKPEKEKREIYDSVKKKLHHNHCHFIGRYDTLKRREKNYYRYLGAKLR